MKPLYAIGANIFAGGFTLGVSKHFKVLAHLEHADRYGAHVAQANFKGLQVFAPEGDQPPLDAWPKKFSQKIDFVYANPPCAVWSTLGGAAQRGFDWRLDPRLQRVRDILALIERYRPTVWCFESVCGAFTKGREFIDELVKDAAARGYAATFCFIDAQHYGIAQSRKRFFLVLHRVSIDWKAPRFNDGRENAFADIKKITPKRMGDVNNKWNPIFIKVIKESKPGEPLAKAYSRIFGDNYPRNARGQAKGRFARSARRLGLDGVSGAVVSPWLFHPKEDRQLSLEEFSILTGFPQRFDWRDRNGKVSHDPTVRLMARGVMPPVAEWLAGNIARAIRTGKKVKGLGPFYADFRVASGYVGEAAVIEAPRAKAKRQPGAPRLPAAPRVKAPPVDYDALAKTAPPLPKGAPVDEGSGVLIRHLIGLGRYHDVIVAAMARRQFHGKTTAADVAWNRGRLKKAGVMAPRVPGVFLGAPAGPAHREIKARTKEALSLNPSAPRAPSRPSR